MKHYTMAERLENKAQQNMVVNRLTNHYRFSPAMSEALYKDTIFINALFNPETREDGQIIIHLPLNTEPAGKPLKDCQYVACRITVRHPEDGRYLQENGVKALKLKLIQRFCEEAVAQGAAMTHEDLGQLLFCERTTISDYIGELKSQGVTILTRADFTDQGRGFSHRTPIIKYFLKGLSATEIVKRSAHTLLNVENYLQNFFRIAILYQEGKSVISISGLTRLSESLVAENIRLFEELKSDENYREPLLRKMSFYQSGLFSLKKTVGE